jgi:pimeloyl-ACP methyl ester carboxylesterase
VSHSCYQLVHEPDDPAAPTLVIVHGAMDRAMSFGRVVRQLHDVRVIRYDRRGYGRSRELAITDLDGHVADLMEVVAGRRVTVFGHSIGAVIALVAASRWPGLVTSVLAYEPPTPWADWWPRPAPAGPLADPADEAEAFMVRAIGERYWSRLPARTRAQRRAEGGALQADIASVREPVFEPGEVTVPVLVAAGSDTSWWHARAARELASSLGAGELVELAGAGHGAHLTHPSAVAGLARRALRQQ